MIEKYTYYLYLNSVWTLIEPLNNDLKLAYKINEQFEGMALKELEGSFVLSEPYFTQINSIYSSNTALEIKIYELDLSLVETEIYYGRINNFNDYNYNEKTVILKDFETIDQSHELIELIGKESEKYINQGTSYQINSVDDGLITNASYKFANIINSLLPGSLVFSATSAWYNTALFDFGKLRLADINDLTNFSGDGSPKRITLKRLIEIIQTLKFCYVYVDGNNLKFKTVDEFVVNILDISTELEYIKIKRFDSSKKYLTEIINYSVNNGSSGSYPTGFDEDTALIEYSYNTVNNKKYDLKDVQTFFNPTEFNYNTDCWYFAFVENTDFLELYELTDSGNDYENGRLMAENIIYHNYRDYLYTNNINYTYNTIQETVKPTHYRPFIELPDVQQVLPSIATFIDGIKYEVDGTDEMIGRVWEMSTDLDSGITTFKSFEFMNSIN